MNCKERFKLVCSHQYPDRFPIDYVASASFDRKLRNYYGVSSESELLENLGCDFYYLSVRDISQNETSLPIYRGPILEFTETERVCPFGIRFRRGSYNWKFGADEVVQSPLQNADTERDVLSLKLPDPKWFDLEPLLRECQTYQEKVIIGGFWTAISGDAYRMMGFENYLANMIINPSLVKTLVDRLTDFYLQMNDRLFSVLKGKMDIFFMGNDFGTQNGLLFSKEMWRKYFYENYKKLISLAHSYKLKVMVHSCGAISELLDDMIEIGVDIIDPIQTTAVGMNPLELQRRFGGKIVFHGGIDTQNILPRGNTEQVNKHCEEILNYLGKDAGYIFVSCNNIQDDTPVKNVDTAYRVAREFKPKQVLHD